MPERSDDELGMRRPISRRDFIDGVAVAVGAVALGGLGTGAAAADTGRKAGDAYPPALQGMRGYTNDSMTVPHRLRDGTFWRDAGEPRRTGEEYDLVVVGGGISGLSAARFYQREFDRDARILILDALDDVGGHARRNEFRAHGRLLVGYGGSQSLESPSTFSREARSLIEDVGIEVKRFKKYFDSGFDARHGLGRALYFDKESWGRDHFVAYRPGTEYAEILRNAPMADRAKSDLSKIYDAPEDWMAGLTDKEKKDRLARITYREYLTEHVRAHPDAVRFLQTTPNGNWGYGADAVGALDASIEFAGFDGLGLDWDQPDRRLAPTGQKLWTSEDDYIYHFPEGNGGVARALVRKLIPDALPGRGMETITTSLLHYDRLDRKGNRVRIRLSAPAVRVRHVDHARRVEIAYVQSGDLRTVHARHVVLACNNQMIPYLTEEISAEQRAALQYAGKLSLVYTNVQVRDWTAFDRLKISSVRYPTMYWGSAGLDFPVSMGDYRFPDDPREPAILHLAKTMCKPGLPPREQGQAGRRELLATSFQDMERAIRDQLGRALGNGGFDPARDIEGITVNRWSHAYAYEYGLPWDTFWPDGELPSHVARRRWGRVAVANSDSAPRAYVDSAIDMAYRAVRDLAGKPSDSVSRGVDGVAP
ncbi:NAD(P)/FAD-dependent oxidoreductase [Planotetraspora phitsanulokensis]|uniref:Spermidine dehydrogenase SpdH n=1 Tax=Planotetraspora phitsanulokensis TaxID=575192 RepID=A0A8J3U5R3_9ACTN|nr:NAD(P)/FAD-dependent oxidoreductase [Planotetraspora phitsanulokensis]GII36539.1 spermidine dehydrogenase SpdH [Planotetraspora phitsanulokensis]